MSSALELILNDEQAREFLGGVLGSLPDCDKREMVDKAIQRLAIPHSNSGGWSTNYSPLQDAFNRAVESLMRVEVERFVNSDSKTRARVVSMVEKAACSALLQVDDLKSEVTASLALAFSRAVERHWDD